MNSLLNVAYLLTCSDTKHAFVGGMRHFHVNMSFSYEDRILIKKLYVLKAMKQTTY